MFVKSAISPSKASKFTGPVASEARQVTSGHLSYAVGGPVHGITMDNKTESQCSRALQSHGGQEHGLDEGILEVKGGLVAASL